MLVNCIRLISRIHPSRIAYQAATTKDQYNYYSLLEIQEGATEQAIRNAYAELTKGLLPEVDAKRFKELSQAFVILTDGKTRDAYDSLLKVRKTYYLSGQEASVPSTRSFLSQRRQEKLQQLKSKMNIDQFGRYKGGLPQKYGHLRGVSRSQAGVMHRPREIEEELDRFPEFNNVTTEKAQSFKNFHQDEREARQMKWPWFSFQVDYDYFTFRTFRKTYWPWIQFLTLIFYILPTLYYGILKFEKQQSVKHLKEKAQKKAEAETQTKPSTEHA